MTTQTTQDSRLREPASNEAAERLLSDPSVLLMFSGPEIIGLNEGELALQLGAVIAAERRATVERIRAAVNRNAIEYDTAVGLAHLDRILDEEAAR